MVSIYQKFIQRTRDFLKTPACFFVRLSILIALLVFGNHFYCQKIKTLYFKNFVCNSLISIGILGGLISGFIVLLYARSFPSEREKKYYKLIEGLGKTSKETETFSKKTSKTDNLLSEVPNNFDYAVMLEKIGQKAHGSAKSLKEVIFQTKPSSMSKDDEKAYVRAIIDSLFITIVGNLSIMYRNKIDHRIVTNEHLANICVGFLYEFKKIKHSSEVQTEISKEPSLLCLPMIYGIEKVFNTKAKILQEIISNPKVLQKKIYIKKSEKGKSIRGHLSTAFIFSIGYLAIMYGCYEDNKRLTNTCIDFKKRYEEFQKEWQREIKANDT